MLLRGVGTCPRAAVSCGAGGVQHSALSGDGLSVCETSAAGHTARGSAGSYNHI